LTRIFIPVAHAGIIAAPIFASQFLAQFLYPLVSRHRPIQLVLPVGIITKA